MKYIEANISTNKTEFGLITVSSVLGIQIHFLQFHLGHAKPHVTNLLQVDIQCMHSIDPITIHIFGSQW